MGPSAGDGRPRKTRRNTSATGDVFPTYITLLLETGPSFFCCCWKFQVPCLTGFNVRSNDPHIGLQLELSSELPDQKTH